MTKIAIDVVELKSVDFNVPYVTKDRLITIFPMKDSKYATIKKKFVEKINEGYYPAESILDLGREMFNIYAFLHFATNYKKFDLPYLKDRIPPFNKNSIKVFKDLGVNVA